MATERFSQPFTKACKNSHHFSREDGVYMTTPYCVEIETVKMYLLDIKGCLAHIFRSILLGNKSYETLIPLAVSL